MCNSKTQRHLAAIVCACRPRWGVRTPQRAVPTFLAEWKICLYSRHICPVDTGCFGQPAFALCAFRRQQMASRRMRPQDLATGGDLEAFRDCFARFAACNGLRHNCEEDSRRCGDNKFFQRFELAKAPNPKQQASDVSASMN